MKRDETLLDRLFSPRSIAVVGASEKASTLAGLSVVNLKRYGFAGRVYPVNPRHQELHGLRCYRTVDELPEVPDTAIVAVPADDVLRVVDESAHFGIRTFTVLSSGFGEGTNTETSAGRRQRLIDFVRSKGIRLLGPNCIGVINVRDRAIQRAAAFLPPEITAGQVAFISQSGGASLIAFNRAQAAGLGVSYVIPTGNEFDVDVNDVFEYLVDEGSSWVICLFLESIRDGLRLVATSRRARERGIAVFAVKVGRSEAGDRAVSAHTGAISGQDDVYSAAMDLGGIVRVNDVDALHEAARVVVERGRPASNRAAVICVSGGEAAWLADESARVGLALPAPAGKTRQALAARLRFGAVNNPLDLTGQLFSGDLDLAHDALTAIANDPNFDSVLLAVPTLGANISSWLGPVIANVQTNTTKPIVVSWWGAGAANREVFEHLKELGITAFDTAYRALAALAAAAQAVAPLPKAPSSPKLIAASPPTDLDSYVRSAVPFVDAVKATSAEAAASAAMGIGFPVVVKIVSSKVAHKSELGAVVINIRTEADLRKALDRLERLKESLGDARFEVQRHLEGVELLVSGRWDEAFGSVVTVAAGGVWTEVFADARTYLAPISKSVAADALSRLRIAPLLQGYRGAKVETESAVAFVKRFSEAIARLGPTIASIEVNPVIVTAEGAFAVDLLIERPAAASSNVRLS